jgi:hypothetical protein
VTMRVPTVLVPGMGGRIPAFALARYGEASPPSRLRATARQARLRACALRRGRPAFALARYGGQAPPSLLRGSLPRLRRRRTSGEGWLCRVVRCGGDTPGPRRRGGRAEKCTAAAGLTITAPARVIRASVHNHLDNRVSWSPVTKPRLRGTRRQQCIFQSDGERPRPHRAAVSDVSPPAAIAVPTLSPEG